MRLQWTSSSCTWTPKAHWPLSASSCHSHSSPDSFSLEMSFWPQALVAPLPPRTSPCSGRNPYRWRQVPGLWTFSSSSLLSLLRSFLPLAPSLSSLPGRLNRLQLGLLGSCFLQMERRRGRPFPFSWLLFRSATGTDAYTLHALSAPPTHSLSLCTLKNTSLTSPVLLPHCPASTSSCLHPCLSLFHTHCYKFQQLP